MCGLLRVLVWAADSGEAEGDRPGAGGAGRTGLSKERFPP